MKIRTEHLIGAALDWAVAKSEGHTLTTDGISQLVKREGLLAIIGPVTAGGRPCGYSPSSYGNNGVPIIDRHGIATRKDMKTGNWYAMLSSDLDLGDGMTVEWSERRFNGPTMLIAAMRCYVASKLGEEVDIPGQLAKPESMRRKYPEDRNGN